MITYLGNKYTFFVFLLSALFLTACAGDIKTGELNILGETATLDMPAIPKSGSHAIVIFSEMHYQPSYKSQEIPRIMPNPEAVPMNGKEINIDSAKIIDFARVSNLFLPQQISIKFLPQ